MYFILVVDSPDTMKTVTWDDAATASNPMECNGGGTCVVNLLDLNLVDT